MILSELDIVYGIFTLIFILISFLIGVLILLKYFKYKINEFITVGFCWLLLGSGWWGAVVSFICIFFFGFKLNIVIYLLLGNLFLPIALSCWIYSFCGLVYPHFKKKIMTITLIICCSYEALLIIFLVINPEIIGTMEGTIYYSPNLFALCFQLLCLGTIIITGFIFSKISLQSKDPRVRWKGRFFLIAIILLSVGIAIDVGITTNIVILIIDRIILMMSSFFFYLGFFLPKPIAQILIKKKEIVDRS